MSGRSRTPWSHVLVGGSNERARNAGGAAGMGGAASVGRGGAERARRRAREGRRPAHECRPGPEGGWGRCARGRAGVGRFARTSDSISACLPVERTRGSRRKSARRFGAAALATTPETGAPGCAQGLLWLLHRLRAHRARATAGRPIWAKAPQRRSNGRRGQLFDASGRAGALELLLLATAAAARFQRARVDAQRPAPARVMKSSLLRPVSKGCGGPTSGLHSSRRCRKTPRNDMTLVSGRAAGRAVALRKGGSTGSFGRCGPGRAPQRPRPANPQRHGRAAESRRAHRTHSRKERGGV